MTTAGHWYWALWFGIGFCLLEVFALVNDDFPTLSESWRHARSTWPQWASILLVLGTFAVGFWLLTIHWGFSVFDRAGRWDDVVSGLVGVMVGVLALVAERRSRARHPPDGDSL